MFSILPWIKILFSYTFVVSHEEFLCRHISFLLDHTSESQACVVQVVYEEHTAGLLTLGREGQVSRSTWPRPRQCTLAGLEAGKRSSPVSVNWDVSLFKITAFHKLTGDTIPSFVLEVYIF